jgi:hypothetical protein
MTEHRDPANATNVKSGSQIIKNDANTNENNLFPAESVIQLGIFSIRRTQPTANVCDLKNKTIVIEGKVNTKTFHGTTKV